MTNPETVQDRQARLDALTGHQRAVLLAYIDGAAPRLVDEGLAELGLAAVQDTEADRDCSSGASRSLPRPRGSGRSPARPR